MRSKLGKGQALLVKLFQMPPDGPGFSVPADFLRYTTEHLFGDLWQGEGLALEERSLISCTVVVALAREAEQRFHFRGARNLGISRAKLEAMITHVAHYAGWPVAASALRVQGEVWSQMDEEGNA